MFVPEKPQTKSDVRHWTDSIAEQLSKNGQPKQVIATGTSLSGEPHVGNANDVIRGDAIKQAVLAAGQQAELVWIADDMDPFRSVPVGFPKSLEQWLGHPVALIPDPWKCHKSFVAHFEDQFLRDLKSLDIKPKAFFGVEMYKSGFYN